MQEYIDIVDKEGKKTGESRTYEEVHRDGLLHHAVHIWFLNSNKQLLLQKRSKNRRAYPSHWDISVAGHISAGETNVEAAQKETREEIGLVLPPSAYKYLFTVEEHIILNDGTYVNNEFQDVFIVHSDISISDLKLSADEAEEIRWLDVDSFEEWIKGKGEKVVPHEEEYRRLLEYIKVQN